MDLKQRVYEANLELVKRGLVIYTWGNVSEIDREKGIVVIKPRGIEYQYLSAEDMSVTDLDGNLIEGKYLPSVDLDIHLEMYKAFPEMNAIAHTHSTFATAWSQLCRPVPCYGTTHADHFPGEIPVADIPSEEEVHGEYEKGIGKSIARALSGMENPERGAVLAAGHGPFTWGTNAAESVEFSVILEEICKMSYLTESMGHTSPIPTYMSSKHYNRKYGKDAYFYQDLK